MRWQRLFTALLLAIGMILAGIFIALVLIGALNGNVICSSILLLGGIVTLTYIFYYGD